VYEGHPDVRAGGLGAAFKVTEDHAVVEAFRLIGWGWGGAWTGSTKDYMHFSSSGH
jgi:hypothetical protein